MTKTKWNLSQRTIAKSKLEIKMNTVSKLPDALETCLMKMPKQNKTRTSRTCSTVTEKGVTRMRMDFFLKSCHADSPVWVKHVCYLADRLSESKIILPAQTCISESRIPWQYSVLTSQCPKAENLRVITGIVIWYWQLLPKELWLHCATRVCDRERPCPVFKMTLISRRLLSLLIHLEFFSQGL